MDKLFLFTPTVIEVSVLGTRQETTVDQHLMIKILLS